MDLTSAHRSLQKPAMWSLPRMLRLASTSRQSRTIYGISRKMCWSLLRRRRLNYRKCIKVSEMNLMSVNLGQERILQRNHRVERTGIFKFPTRGAVKVTKLGLEDDVIISKKHHGGPDQAVYVYGAADYEWWSRELGIEIAPGMFGENLTIGGLESAQFNIGDYIHIDDVT